MFSGLLPLMENFREAEGEVDHWNHDIPPVVAHSNCDDNSI